MRDLTYFQRLTLFAGLFFASAPGLVDGGGADTGDAGGGGDDGGAGGTGDEGAADDSGTDGAGETDDAGISEESEQVDEGDEADEGEVGSAPKPITDAQIQKKLDTLRKTDPALASALRKEHFQNRDYRRAGTPTEVMEMHEAVETYGGLEGMADISQKADTFADELVQISQGDPAIIDTLAADYPEALPKLAPHAMEKLRQINPQAYERSASGITASFLRDKGVVGSVARLAELIADGKQAPAHELATKLAEWIKSTEEFGKAAPREQESEAEKRIKAREAELNKQDQTFRHRQIGQAVTTQMNGVISKHLTPYLKGRNLTLDQKKLVSKGIYDTIADSLSANGRYQARLKSLVARGNAQEVARFVGSNVDKIAANAVKSVWNASGHGSAKKKVAAGAGNGRVATASVTRIPEAFKIDWTQDPTRARFMRGEATLKKEYGGKILRWDINQVQ